MITDIRLVCRRNSLVGQVSQPVAGGGSNGIPPPEGSLRLGCNCRAGEIGVWACDGVNAAPPDGSTVVLVDQLLFDDHGNPACWAKRAFQ
jgi:hypothetical protein